MRIHSSPVVGVGSKRPLSRMAPGCRGGNVSACAKFPEHAHFFHTVVLLIVIVGNSIRLASEVESDRARQRRVREACDLAPRAALGHSIFQIRTERFILGVLGPLAFGDPISESQATDRSTFCPMPGGSSQAASDGALRPFCLEPFPRWRLVFTRTGLFQCWGEAPMGTLPCRPSGVRIRAASVQLPRAGAVSLPCASAMAG